VGLRDLVEDKGCRSLTGVKVLKGKKGVIHWIAHFFYQPKIKNPTFSLLFLSLNTFGKQEIAMMLTFWYIEGNYRAIQNPDLFRLISFHNTGYVARFLKRSQSKLR